MNEENRQEYYEDEIDLMELIMVLWRRKGLIIGIVVLSVFFAMAWVMSGSKTVTEEMVQVGFQGIDKHEYPDKTPFDMYDIITPDLLLKSADAIRDTDHRDIFINNPRSYVFVDPFIPPEIGKKISDMEKRKETYNYFPNQFYVRFIDQGKGIFSHEEKKDLLFKLNDNYERYFVDRFVEKPLLANNLPENMLEMRDYMDIVDIMSSTADTQIAFLGERIKDAGYYRSSATGDSFVDILDSINNIKNIDIAEIESILKISLLTKSEGALLKRYEYKIKDIEKLRKKKYIEAKISRKMLEDAWKKDRGVAPLNLQDEKNTQIVLDATIVDKLSEKEYISSLLTRSLDSEVEASALKIDKEYLQKELNMIAKKDNKSGKAYSPDQVEKSIERIRKTITDLGQKANILNREYMQNRYSNIIKGMRQPKTHTVYKKSPAKVGVLAMVASGFLAIFFAFFVEFIANARKRHVKGR